MPRRVWSGIAPVGVLFALLLGTTRPELAAGCACCARPGQWSSAQMVFPTDHAERDWFVGQLQRLRLHGRVLPESPARAEVLLPGSWPVVGRYVLGRWEFRFETGQTTGDAVVAVFDGPNGYEEFKSDTGHRDSEGMVRLYKEWRFWGHLKSDSAGMPAVGEERRAVLVLQGEGNNCSDVRDFSHWVMQFNLRGGGTVEPVVASGSIDVVQ